MPGSGPAETVDVAALMRHLGGLLPRVLDESISVVLDVPAGPWTARADPARLEASVLEAVRHARDAAPTGGMLVLGVRASAAQAGERRVEVSVTRVVAGGREQTWPAFTAALVAAPPSGPP